VFGSPQFVTQRWLQIHRELVKQLFSQLRMLCLQWECECSHQACTIVLFVKPRSYLGASSPERAFFPERAYTFFMIIYLFFQDWIWSTCTTTNNYDQGLLVKEIIIKNKQKWIKINWLICINWWARFFAI